MSIQCAQNQLQARYKKGWDMAEQQQAFSDACAIFASERAGRKEAKSSTNYYCWIDDFRAWAIKRGYGFPVETSAFLTAAVEWRDSLDGWANASAAFENKVGK